MGIRVVFSFSIQERITSIANSMATGGTISFHLRRVIPTAVHPYKQGSGVAGPWALHCGDTEPGLTDIL
jgi:hypothetical protein